MRFLSYALLAAFLSAAGTTTARAQISFITSQNQAAFTNSLNANPAQYTETFTNLTLSGPSFTFTGPSPSNHFSYQFSVPGGSNPDSLLYTEGTFIGNNDSADALTFTALAGNFNAVGANLFITDIDNVFQSGAAMTVTVTNAAAQSNNITVNPTSINDFLSIHSPNSPITSIVFASPDNSLFLSVDNVVVGISPVPEPTLLLAGTAGLALVVGRVRRRFVSAPAA